CCASGDSQRPGWDGMAMWQNLGAMSGASMPRFIFLAADPEVEFAVAALRLGAVDFLVKPVRPQELLAAVRNAVERIDQSRAAMLLTDQAAMLEQQAEA